MNATAEITAHGRTYSTRPNAVARIAELEADNERYGASDGRVTEINAIWEALEAAPAEEPEEVWEVVRDEFPSPCDHPLCALLHRRFFTASLDSAPYDEIVELANGGTTVVRNLRGSHEKTNRQWVILRNGERRGSAWETKAEAVREMESRPRY